MTSHILRPIAFTAKDGGKWLPWMGECVSEEILADRAAYTKHNRNPVATLWQGTQRIKLHSLKFADGREWDCINGWR